MKKNKIFVACDTSNLNEIKKIINQTNSNKLKIIPKFGLQFFYSKDGRKFLEKFKQDFWLDLKINDIPQTALSAIDSLKDLKGSPLKVAQMLSMEKSILPRAYVEKFSLAQFSVPPLSEALVLKTFKKSFGKYPSEIYDEFDVKAYNAASIGQVHKATLKGGEKVAVKIQRPGLREQITLDLYIVRNIAIWFKNNIGIIINNNFSKFIFFKANNIEVRKTIISKYCKNKNLKLT